MNVTFITVYCSILLLVVNFLVCLIYKLNFIGMVYRKKNVVYIGFGTVCG